MSSTRAPGATGAARQLGGNDCAPHNTARSPYPQDRILLCELQQCVSAKGTTYLRGFLGKARLVGFAKPVGEEGLPPGVEQIWQIFVTPGKSEGGR